MSVFNVACIRKNVNGVDYIDNIAVFEREGFYELLALIEEYNLSPGTTYIPMEELVMSPLCLDVNNTIQLGWIRLPDGGWDNPNYVPPVEEPPVEPESN